MDIVHGHGNMASKGRRSRIQVVDGGYGTEATLSKVLHPDESHEVQVRLVLACFDEVVAALRQMVAPWHDGVLFEE